MSENIERPEGLSSIREIMDYLKRLAELPPKDLELALSKLNPQQQEQVRVAMQSLKSILPEKE